MTTTPTTHETVSATDASTTPLLERPASTYEYLGRDTEDYHHHHDRIENMIYVTQGLPEEFHPDCTDEPWIRVRGPAHHTEALDQYDDRGVREWIGYVQSVRGWSDRPTTVRTHRTPDRLILKLERPITPGDVERAYCELRTAVEETND